MSSNLTPSATVYLTPISGVVGLETTPLSMHLRPEKEPDRVERTQDGRWQVYHQGKPSKPPFVKEKLAFAHLKVCVAVRPTG